MLAQRHVTRQVRQAVRGRPPVKGARRQLWKRDVKQWLQLHDRGADWELPAAEKRQLVEWFNALDIDGSGSVEVEEIKALMSAVGAQCTQAMLISMFASIQKHITDELNMHDFVKLMHLNGGGIFREDGDGGAGGGTGADSAGLMMMSYRRQRILSDIRDPSKRSAFSSKESFERQYGNGQKKRRGSSFSVSIEDDGAAHAATYSDLRGGSTLAQSGSLVEPTGFAARMLAGGSLSQKSMDAQPAPEPRAKWLAATTVKINEGRKSMHAQKQKQQQSATGEQDRPSTPELIEALEVRKDAVTGGVRVVGGDRGIGLMQALEANMSKEGISLRPQEEDSSQNHPAAAAPSWGDDALAPEPSGEVSHATSVPKLPPLAN